MRRLALAVAVLVGWLAPCARAQARVSLQGGISSVQQEPYAELGVRVSPAPPAVLGVDFSLDLYPQLLESGGVVGVVDLSLAYVGRVARGASIELRAGGSALAGVGGGGAAAIPGYNLGAGLLLGGDGAGFRVDYTWRRLQTGEEAYPLPSFTIGLVLRH